MAEEAWFPKLNENTNFSNFKFRLKLILEEKSVLSVLESDKPDPKDDAKARSIIARCVSDKYIEVIKRCQSAKEMLTQLEDMFERKSICNKLHLKRRLLSLKCDVNEKLQDFFLKFDNIINQLEAIGAKVEPIDQICYLLEAMPKRYNNVVTSIETMTTEKTINIEFIKARLLDAEMKMEDEPQMSNQEEAFLSCYSCGKRGHKSSQCRVRGQNRGRTMTRGNFYNNRGRSYRRSSRGSWQSRPSSSEQGNTATTSEISFTAAFCANINSDNHEIKFVIDSGATENLIMDKYEQEMTDIEDLEKEVKIYVANGQYLTSKKKGNIHVKFNNISIKIQGLIVKNLSHNLLSVQKLLQKGNSVRFYDNLVKIYSQGACMYGKMFGRLYVITFKLNNEFCNAINDITENDLWHRRLGHANRRHLKILHLPYSETPCGPCMEGKSTRLPFDPVPKPRSYHIGELLHTDISGPVSTPNLNGEIYYHTIVDDYSHFCVVYLLKGKHEATDNLINYIQQLETQTGNKVKKIRCDNGGEFKNQKIQDFCRQKGINIQYTIPYSPQSNGVSERMNRTIYNKARTLLLETGLPKYLWGEAVRCAVYQINRCPSSAINFNAPAKIMTGKSDLSKLKVFGSKAWAVTIPKKDKFERRAKEMRFIGYSPNGYRLWDPEKNEIVISRDVRFNEQQIKYKEQQKQEDEYMKHYEEKEENNEKEAKQKKKEDQNIEENQNKIQRQNKEEREKKKEEEEVENIENNLEENKNDENSDEEEYEESTDQPITTTRSGRIIKKPKKLHDYDLNIAYCLCSGLPTNYEEAVQIEEWQEAINKELNSHNKLETWEEAYLPDGTKAIETKWIFRQKQDGTKKARLVAKGFQQISKNQYYYSPVATMPTVRTMLSQAIQNNLKIKQLDVPTAFLNGKLEEDVYIKCPDGVKLRQGNVLKLKKALYGLKEAPKCWNQRFHEFIIKNGFEQSKHDVCLYIKDNTWLLIFVDDILILGEGEEIIAKLKKEFNIKDLGEIKNYLGLEITKRKDRLQITQKEMIQKLLIKFNMQECKGVNTPLETNFNADIDAPIIDVPFKELIGSLLYISTNSRPDIAFAVSYLSRFLDKPTQQLWTAGKRILRYLKATMDKSLIYTKFNGPVELKAYSDADWGSDRIDRKSTSGCAIFHGKNIITWFSRKQSSIALSTAEAEFVAGAIAVTELLHIKGVFSDLNYNKPIPIHLFIDNQSTIKLIQNNINSKASKHIAIKYHFIKDVINKKMISLSYVPTDENVSDIFTKALPMPKHMYFSDKLNLK